MEPDFLLKWEHKAREKCSKSTLSGGMLPDQWEHSVDFSFSLKKKKKENGKKWLDQLDSLQDAFVAVFRLADARTHEVWPADKVAKSLAQAFGTHHKTRLQVNTRKREKNIKKAPQQEENLGLDAKKNKQKKNERPFIDWVPMSV